MKYTVQPPDRYSQTIIRGPQFMCHLGDEQCAWTTHGACTRIPCTCETQPSCDSCPPR